MNRLDEILRAKRAEIEQLLPQAHELHRQAEQRNDFRSFHSALRRADGSVAIIAEIKKASPSAGVITNSFDPVGIAKNYERDGADAISVLTDRQFFQGQLNHLAQVRATVSLPLLRKDFILDELQIAESGAAGAVRTQSGRPSGARANHHQSTRKKSGASISDRIGSQG